MDDVFVYLVDLPEGIHEMVAPCAEGYTVYLRNSDCPEKRANHYKHALKHIEAKDFEKTDVQQIEADAHEHSSKNLKMF